MICISALNKTVHSIYFSWKCLINSCLLQVERNCYYSSSFCSKNFGTGPRRMLSNAMSKKEENLLIPDPSPDIYSIRSVCSFFSKWQCINGSWEVAFGKKMQQKKRRAWKYIGYIGNIHSFDLYHIIPLNWFKPKQSNLFVPCALLMLL